MPSNDATIIVTFKPATYSITVADNIENGTVSAPASAAYGETVTLTVVPANDSYVLSSLTVTYDAAEPETLNAPRRATQNVTTTKVDDTHYTFEMPAGDVMVNATFIEKVVTGISDINATDGKHVRYFDLKGRYIGTSLNGAANGIYVTNDGRKVIK
jgi:hypothetical protein